MSTLPGWVEGLCQECGKPTVAIETWDTEGHARENWLCEACRKRILTGTPFEVLTVTPVEIEVCERLMDAWYDYDDGGKRRPKYHAQIKDQPGRWACGKTPDEAIGNLVTRHPELFGLTIATLGKLAR